MMLNLLLNTHIPGPGKPNKPKSEFLDFGKLLIQKSNLTKGMYFYLIVTVVYLSFFLFIAVAPTIVYAIVAIRGGDLNQIKPPIPLTPLLTGLFIWFIVGIMYYIAYSIPEIRDRWFKK